MQTLHKNRTNLRGYTFMSHNYEYLVVNITPKEGHFQYMYNIV